MGGEEEEVEQAVVSRVEPDTHPGAAADGGKGKGLPGGTAGKTGEGMR